MFGVVSFPFRSDSKDHMARQTMEENQPWEAEPVLDWWQGWVFSTLQEL